MAHIRYDASSLGESEGDKETVEFADWVDNAATVLERLGSHSNVIVGSSMGGWIGLWLASQREFAGKISGLVLVAPAVNFTRPHYQRVYSSLPATYQQRLDRGEVGGEPAVSTCQSLLCSRWSTSSMTSRGSWPSGGPSWRTVISSSWTSAGRST